MKTLPAVLIALACAMPALCGAQWMWVDGNGRKVMSDQPPPPDVPAKNILKQPGKRMVQPEEAAAAAAAASAPAKPVLPAGKTGKDKVLEEKKKAAEAAEADKVKAQNDEADRNRAENCTRAKQAKAQLDAGTRLARTNAKGEREVLDDAARAVEARRIEGIMARDCGPRAG